MPQFKKGLAQPFQHSTLNTLHFNATLNDEPLDF
jgi:hypothetical protein